MLSKNLSLKAQAWALLGASVLFLYACSGNNPVTSSTEESKPTPIPKVFTVMAQPRRLAPGQTSTLTVMDADNLGDELSYSWSARGGKISGKGKQATFIAFYLGTAYVNVEVRNGQGVLGSGDATLIVE